MSAPAFEAPLAESTTEYATGAAGRKHRHDLPHLRLVAPLRPERASRGLFAVVITAMLALGLVVMLVINTSVAQTAFTVSELQIQQRELARTEAALTEELSAVAAPPVLEAKARAIGMVPSGRPVFVTIPSGEVKGRAKPARGDTSRTANVATSLTASLLDPVPGSGAAMMAPRQLAIRTQPRDSAGKSVTVRSWSTRARRSNSTKRPNKPAATRPDSRDKRSRVSR